jgi:AraC-like DNA-binding protein
MEAGDVVIFPRGDAHVMGSHVGVRPLPIGRLLPSQPSEEIPSLDHGGGGEATRFVCGFLHCDQAFNPLMGALPTLLCVSGRDHAGQRPRSEAEAAERPGVVLVGADGWLATTLRHTIEEADATHPGSSAMLARLTELLYLDVVRRYMQKLPSGQSGWLAGVNDPEVGRALRLLHARPERPWTVEDLAHEVGVSRSALAQRFSELIGEAPMRYLTGWRIQLAKHLILQSGLPIAEVADRVGYESEAAFNRAVKRHVGVPPVAWRKGTEGKGK